MVSLLPMGKLWGRNCLASSIAAFFKCQPQSLLYIHHGFPYALAGSWELCPDLQQPLCILGWDMEHERWRRGESLQRKEKAVKSTNKTRWHLLQIPGVCCIMWMLCNPPPPPPPPPRKTAKTEDAKNDKILLLKLCYMLLVGNCCFKLWGVQWLSRILSFNVYYNMMIIPRFFLQITASLWGS